MRNRSTSWVCAARSRSQRISPTRCATWTSAPISSTASPGCSPSRAACSTRRRADRDHLPAVRAETAEVVERGEGKRRQDRRHQRFALSARSHATRTCCFETKDAEVRQFRSLTASLCLAQTLVIACAYQLETRREEAQVMIDFCLFGAGRIGRIHAAKSPAPPGRAAAVRGRCESELRDGARAQLRRAGR